MTLVPLYTSLFVSNFDNSYRTRMGPHVQGRYRNCATPDYLDKGRPGSLGWSMDLR